MTTLDPDAIERREREARRLADMLLGNPHEAAYAWHSLQVICPALCDDIKALREALAERDADYRKRIAAWQVDAESQAERVRELEARLAEADAVIWEDCIESEVTPDEWTDPPGWNYQTAKRDATERYKTLARARQEAKPHE